MPAESSPISVKKVGKESRVLCIGNLNSDSTAEQIKELFERYGRVLNVKFVSVKNERFGIVSFLDIRTASKAHASENFLSGNKLLTAYQCPGEVVPQSLFEAKREKQNENNSIIRQTAKADENIEKRSEIDSIKNKTPIVKNGLLITNLQSRISASNLKDALFREFKQYGTINAIKVEGEHESRKAIISFQRATDALKASIKIKDVPLFGDRIKCEVHEGLDYEDPDLYKVESEIQYSPNATRTLYIGNLPYSILEDRLRAMFSEFGEVLVVDIKRPSKQPSAIHSNTTSFAFIHFGDIRSVVRAMRKMDGFPLGKTRIKLGFGRILPSSIIWVGNLTRNTTVKDLKEFCLQYGNYKIYNVLVDQVKLQGLIYFENTAEAESCINYIRGAKLAGNRLETDFASKEFIQMRFKDLIETVSVPQNRCDEDQQSYWHQSAAPVPSTHRDWMDSGAVAYVTGNTHNRERILKTIHATDTTKIEKNTSDVRKECQAPLPNEKNNLITPSSDDPALGIQQQSQTTTSELSSTKKQAAALEKVQTITKKSDECSTKEATTRQRRNDTTLGGSDYRGNVEKQSDLQKKDTMTTMADFENECPGSPSSESRGEAILEWLCRLKPNMAAASAEDTVVVKANKTIGDAVAAAAISNTEEELNKTTVKDDDVLTNDCNTRDEMPSDDDAFSKDLLEVNAAEVKYHLLPLTKVTKLEEPGISPKQDEEKRFNTSVTTANVKLNSSLFHLPIEIPLLSNNADLSDPRERNRTQQKKNVELGLLNFCLAEQARTNHVVIYDPKAHLKHSALGITSTSMEEDNLDLENDSKSEAISLIDSNTAVIEPTKCCFSQLQLHNNIETSSSSIFDVTLTPLEEASNKPLLSSSAQASDNSAEIHLKSNATMMSAGTDDDESSTFLIKENLYANETLSPHDTSQKPIEISPPVSISRTTAEIVENLGLTIRKVSRKDSLNQQIPPVDGPRSILKKPEAKSPLTCGFVSSIFNENTEADITENLKDIDMRLPNNFPIVSPSVYINPKETVPCISHTVIPKPLTLKPDFFSNIVTCTAAPPPPQPLSLSQSPMVPDATTNQLYLQKCGKQRDENQKRNYKKLEDTDSELADVTVFSRKRKCTSGDHNTTADMEQKKKAFLLPPPPPPPAAVTGISESDDENSKLKSSLCDLNNTENLKINHSNDYKRASFSSNPAPAPAGGKLSSDHIKNMKPCDSESQIHMLEKYSTTSSDVFNNVEMKRSTTVRQNSKHSEVAVQKVSGGGKRKRNDFRKTSKVPDSDTESESAKAIVRRVKRSSTQKKSTETFALLSDSEQEIESSKEGKKRKMSSTSSARKSKTKSKVAERSFERSNSEGDSESVSSFKAVKNSCRGNGEIVSEMMIKSVSNDKKQTKTSTINKNDCEHNKKSSSRPMKILGKSIETNKKTMVNTKVVKQASSSGEGNLIDNGKKLNKSSKSTASTTADNKVPTDLRSMKCDLEIKSDIDIQQLHRQVYSTDIQNVSDEETSVYSTANIKTTASSTMPHCASILENNTVTSPSAKIKDHSSKANNRLASVKMNPSANDSVTQSTELVFESRESAIIKDKPVTKRTTNETVSNNKTIKKCISKLPSERMEDDEERKMQKQENKNEELFSIEIGNESSCTVEKSEVHGDFQKISVNENKKKSDSSDSEVFLSDIVRSSSFKVNRVVGKILSQLISTVVESNSNNNSSIRECLLENVRKIEAASNESKCKFAETREENAQENEAIASSLPVRQNSVVVEHADEELTTTKRCVRDGDDEFALNLSQNLKTFKSEESNEDMLSAASSLLVLHKYMPRVVNKTENPSETETKKPDEQTDHGGGSEKPSVGDEKNEMVVGRSGSDSFQDLNQTKKKRVSKSFSEIKQPLNETSLSQELQAPAAAVAQTAERMSPFDLSVRSQQCSVAGNVNFFTAPPRLPCQNLPYKASVPGAFPSSPFLSRNSFCPEMTVSQPGFSSVDFRCSTPFQCKNDINHFYHVPCQNENMPPPPVQYFYETYGTYKMPQQFSTLNNHHPNVHCSSSFYPDLNLQPHKLLTPSPPPSCESVPNFEAQKLDSLTNSEDEGNDSISNESALNLQTNMSNRCLSVNSNSNENTFEDISSRHSESSSPETLNFHEFPFISNYSHYYRSGAAMPFELSLEVNSTIPPIPRPVFPFFCYPYTVPYSTSPFNQDYNISFHDPSQQEFPVIHVNGKAPLSVECFEAIKEQMMKTRIAVACVTAFKNPNELIAQLTDFHDNILNYFVLRKSCGVASTEILNPTKVSCKITLLPPCDLTKNILQMTVPYLTSLFFQTPCMLAIMSCF